jgi:hypothetical protein
MGAENEESDIEDCETISAQICQTYRYVRYITVLVSGVLL